MSRDNISREHKDRLFVFIFGREQNKDWILQLYNAVNQSQYTNPNDIELNTMGDTVYMGVKNDVSFLLCDTINVYEHQSSYNPNMPIRQLIYLSRLYDKHIKREKLNIYSSRKITLPVPKLVVFYNGKTEESDETILNLSDLFPNESDKSISDVQVKVRMLNINYGHNKQLLDLCRPLYEYAWFIDRIRYYAHSAEDVEAAVDKSLDDMPKDFVIREYLIENKAEVKGMCVTEYDEAETMELFKQEYKEEGRQEGRQEGIRSAISKLASHLMADDPNLSQQEAEKQASLILS